MITSNGDGGLRQEDAWLRNEVRHCANVIEVMGHDMESRRREFVLGELSRADAHRQTAVATLARPGEGPIFKSSEDRRSLYWQVYADVLANLGGLE